jgi:O-Antigen ligase
VVRILVAGVLLAGPTALAFDSGGFFDRARTVAGIAAWALVVILAVTGAPLPRSRAAWAAVAGLAGVTAWAAISQSWAPLSEPARDDVDRLIVYTGALLASAMAWRDARDLRLVEPLLAAGALVVALYGLSGRLLPGLIDLDESATAGGRLEQPLTYWNGMGLLAALGLTLATRVAGTPERPRALRAAAAAAAVPFGMTIYLTFSRGAIAAAIVGLAVLLALNPAYSQVRAAIRAATGGVAGAVVVSLLPAVEGLEGGSLSAAEQGVIALVVLVWFAISEVVLSLREGRDTPRSYALPPRIVAIGIGLVVLVGVPLGAVALDSGEAETGATASRLNNLGSNRYDYWEVALDAWADDPLRGSGIAGFRVDWLRDREIDEPVRDAHSLYLETAAELGVVGLLLLGLFVGGVATAAAAAVRREREVVAGAVAALSAFAVHAAIDWDWELPAVALPALVLAGVLLCRAALTTVGGRTG